MRGNFNKDEKTISPEDISPEQLTPLSRQYINWKTGMALAVALFMVVTFFHVVTEPSMTGMSITSAEGSQRFASTLSLLFVIFAFFSILLIAFVKMYKKKK